MKIRPVLQQLLCMVSFGSRQNKLVSQRWRRCMSRRVAQWSSSCSPEIPSRHHGLSYTIGHELFFIHDDWMMRGYPHFGKPPCVYIYIYMVIYLFTLYYCIYIYTVCVYMCVYMCTLHIVHARVCIHLCVEIEV